mmetsp:Transcript_8502/g.53116  ORF Transcript_8502/g.53116 Transcript_8502/m.53116 type:complete len:203 (+) Transcript_8502:522-1130(+)
MPASSWEVSQVARRRPRQAENCHNVQQDRMQREVGTADCASSSNEREAMMRTMENKRTYHIVVKSTHLPACLPLSFPVPSGACGGVSLLLDLHTKLTEGCFLSSQTQAPSLNAKPVQAAPRLPRRGFMHGEAEQFFGGRQRRASSDHCTSPPIVAGGLSVASFDTTRLFRRMHATFSVVSLVTRTLLRRQVFFFSWYAQYMS